MCAIIGASPEPGAKLDKKDIAILYLMAETRGGHACGFTNGKRIIKAAVDSYEFVSNHLKNKKYFNEDVKTFIGHTRFATIGFKGDHSNAHPFSMSNLIGVHNGSIYNYQDLKEITDSTATVDSEVMYELISEFGIKKTLPLLNGVLALSYFDLRNKNIMIYRMNRPLSYGYKEVADEKGVVKRVLVWASLPEYLKAINCVKIKEFKEHVLYTIRDGKIKQARQVAKALKPTPPKTIMVNDEAKTDKTPCLNIWKEKQLELGKLGVNGLAEKIVKKNEVSTIKKSSASFEEVQEVELDVYEPTKTLNIPVNAFGFESRGLGILFYWFDPVNPHVVKVFSQDESVTDSYDLELESDQNRLIKKYGSDHTDIVPHIMKVYDDLLIAYLLRMQIEEDEQIKTCKC